MVDRPPCIVSVDLEEWSDARLAGVPAALRSGLTPSLAEPVDFLLDLLAEGGARATFFTLGRVAQRYPALIRRLAKEHEIGTHGESHTSLPELGPAGLTAEVEASRRRLQDLSGQPVTGFRAPNWSLAGCADWAAPVLLAGGIGYDSSLVPGRGIAFLAGGGDLPRCPYRLVGDLWEIPPTVASLPGASFPVGGAFLRLLPTSVSLGALQRAQGRGEVPHIHLHPWELGRPESAEIGPLRSGLLFAGAGSLAGKLRLLMQRYRGIAAGDLWRQLTHVAGETAMPPPRQVAL